MKQLGVMYNLDVICLRRRGCATRLLIATCDGWTPQNAAHLFQCLWIGDGVGRSWEQAHEDEEWCAAVARFMC